MIRLRPLESKDAASMLEWMLDDQVTQYLNLKEEQKNLDSVLNYIKNSQNDANNKHLAIVDENDEYFGTVSLKNINSVDKHAEFAIVLSLKSQGKGYGKEAMKAILEEAISLGLHKVYLNVLQSNTIAKHFYEKCGFILKGEYEDHIYRNGQYLNLDYYERIV